MMLKRSDEPFRVGDMLLDKTDIAIINGVRIIFPLLHIELRYTFSSNITKEMLKSGPTVVCYSPLLMISVILFSTIDS